MVESIFPSAGPMDRVNTLPAAGEAFAICHWKDNFLAYVVHFTMTKAWITWQAEAHGVIIGATDEKLPENWTYG